MSITDIGSLFRNLRDVEKKIQKRIFRVEETVGNLIIPEEMTGWIRRQFGNADKVEKQKIIKITNTITGEETLFNELRAKRPMVSNDSSELEKEINAERTNCPFCKAEVSTPGDIFERINGLYCTTAANLAKYDGIHSLIIFNEHHPLKFNQEMIKDYFTVAQKWFFRTASRPLYGGDCYPFLMWNCLWRAGSSVVHGHMQLMITPGNHYSRIEGLRRVAIDYFNKYQNNYFEDLYTVLHALHLAFERDSLKIMVSLTPIKEKEVWLVCPGGHKELQNISQTVYKLLKLYKDVYNVNSFNLACYMPPYFKTKEDWSGFPLIVRIVERGDNKNRTADFGAMELFAASVVSTDPFKLASILKDKI